MSQRKTVRAAGGLVWRSSIEHDEHVEVLLVHRPRYDDWSLPKGKADPGEGDEQCALREVEEETGVKARIEAPLSEVRYQDRAGRDKIVRYWKMSVIDAAEFTPNDEVDEIRWCSIGEAEETLSYGHDRELVRVFDGL